MHKLQTPSLSEHHVELTERWAAHNYHPLPVVLVQGKGAWVVDADGKRRAALQLQHRSPLHFWSPWCPKFEVGRDILAL